MNNESGVCLVTGGSGGLGSAIVSALSSNNFKVILNYFNNLPKKFCSANEKQIFPIKADIREYNEVSQMAQTVSEHFPTIDIIINSAGITKDALLIKQREDDWDNVIKTNLKGAFNVIKAFIPLMKNGGHIINISSYSGIKGRQGQVAYSASKSALIGLTRSAAVELAEYNIRVNAIVPGYMPVGMGLKAVTSMENAKKNSLINKLSETQEVANFILYLINTKNITGQIFCLESRIV